MKKKFLYSFAEEVSIHLKLPLDNQDRAELVDRAGGQIWWTEQVDR